MNPQRHRLTVIWGIPEARSEEEPVLQDHPNTNSEGHHRDKGEVGPSASDGKRISAKEDFIELNGILDALKTTVDHPGDLAKHNEVRTTIKNTNGPSLPLQSVTTMSGTLRMQCPNASSKEYQNGYEWQSYHMSNSERST